MIATFVFVPPGGGEADYSLQFEIPGVPSKGDYIQVSVDTELGTRDFIVRRTWWHLGHPKTEPTFAIGKSEVQGVTKGLMVECEYSKGPYSNEGHIAAIAGNKNPNQELVEFEDTAF